jgi:hypothetical protein
VVLDWRCVGILAAGQTEAGYSDNDPTGNNDNAAAIVANRRGGIIPSPPVLS